MNILVTGNLGYNGPVLVQELRRRGHFVVGLDSGLFLNNNFMPLRPFMPDVQVFRDVRRVEAAELKGFGIEKIVHLAALSNDPMGELSPERTIEINTGGTKRLYGIAGEIGASHFIYASSCSIYGKLPDGKRADESIPLEPLTAYAKSKALSEQFLSSSPNPKVKSTVMRYATMFGSSPMLRLDLVVNNLTADAVLNGRATIMSDGTPKRPLLHVRDFAAMTRKVAEDGIEGTYNAGFNQLNFIVKQIGEEVASATGAALSINPQKTPDERSYEVDFSGIEPVAGKKPLFGLRAGIEELAADYRKFRLSREDFEGGRYARAKTLRRLVDGGAISESLELPAKGAA